MWGEVPVVIYIIISMCLSQGDLSQLAELANRMDDVSFMWWVCLPSILVSENSVSTEQDVGWFQQYGFFAANVCVCNHWP